MKLQQLRYLSEVARRGMNVSEAAEALHCSPSFIYSIENGTLTGAPDRLDALEDFYGVARGTIPHEHVSRGIRSAGETFVRALEVIKRQMRRLGLKKLEVVADEDRQKENQDGKNGKP